MLSKAWCVKTLEGMSLPNFSWMCVLFNYVCKINKTDTQFCDHLKLMSNTQMMSWHKLLLCSHVAGILIPNSFDPADLMCIIELSHHYLLDMIYCSLMEGWHLTQYTTSTSGRQVQYFPSLVLGLSTLKLFSNILKIISICPSITYPKISLSDFRNCRHIILHLCIKIINTNYN